MRAGKVTVIAVLLGAALLVAGCTSPQNKNTGGGSNTGQQFTCATSVNATASTMKFGTEAQFAPFETYDPATGQFSGFDIDLATEIGKCLGRNVQFNNMAFTALIPSVNQGTIDAAISAMSITDARRLEVDFSDPYYLANQSVMVKSTSSIAKIEDVNKTGVKIGVQKSTVGADVAHRMGNPTVQEFNDYPTAVQALKAGTVDAVLMDRPAQVEQVTSDSALKIAFDIFTDDNYGIAVKKGNVQLLNDINKALAAVKANGKYAELATKWKV